MGRKLIVTIPQLTPAQREAIAAAAARHGIEAEFYIGPTDAALAAAPEAEIILGNAPALAKAAPRLRWLHTNSAGVNQYTVPGAFASPDAVLTNSSGAYGVTIAEHTIMAALMVLRRQLHFNALAGSREWLKPVPVKGLYGSRITLLGTGDIGRETARRLRGFQPARLLGVNRSGRNPEDVFDAALPIARLDEALPETDILILSLPGTPETHHLLDARRMALLPDGALLVNVGRGAVVDGAALAQELQAGRLCAALDVFETEPLPADDPLWDCPNLLMTPHVAGNLTLPHTLERVLEMFLEDLEHYAAGEPLVHAVDLKKGY